MNEMVKVGVATIGGMQVQAVDARELHEELEVRRDFSSWIKGRIAEYGFIEGQDFVTYSTHPIGGAGNRGARVDYSVAIGMAKELAMVERTDKGRDVRLYFIEMERIAHAKPADPIKALSDPATMRGLLLTYAEKVLALEATVAEQAVPVSVYNTIAATDDTYCMRDAAKILQQRPTDLIFWLSSHKWIHRRGNKGPWLPYQTQIEAGRMVLKLSNNREENMTFEQVRITGKGLTVLGEVFHVQVNGTLNLKETSK